MTLKEMSTDNNNKYVVFKNPMTMIMKMGGLKEIPMQFRDFKLGTVQSGRKLGCR